MSEFGGTLASRRKYKKKKKPQPENTGTKMTAAALRGRKDGKRAHDAQIVSAAQLGAANGGPVHSGELELVANEEDSTDIGDLGNLSGAMLKAHRKELASRKKKVWKKKGKKKRNPNPDLCFDPFELKRSDSFSECRLCLEPGALRGCCGGYYCNKCFYKTDFCPGCDTNVKSLGTVTNDAADPTKNTYGFMEFPSLFRGCIAKIGVYAIVLGVPAGIIYGFLYAPPTTIHGYTCTGFMPSCEIELCSNFLSHMNGTKYYDASGDCNNGYDGHCVCSLGCVYDNYLYTRTNGHLGLDYCESSLNSWSIVMQDHFDDGEWNPKGWSDVKNGEPSTLCNADSANASLVFQGEVVYRSATTVGLDVAYGAKVEFKLRYGNDKGCVDCCQDLFSPGTVTLSLSNNNGPFEPFMTYGIHDYKKNHFTLVSEIIPPERLSQNTKFKWHQDRFARYRDAWALDNVTILAQALPNGWKSTEAWSVQKKKIRSETEKYACCFGSDLCHVNTATTGYHANDQLINDCIRNIEDYPTTVTTKKIEIITVGNETTGVTTTEKISYHNHTSTIIVQEPAEWLKNTEYNGGQPTIRYERGDDATYALLGCLLIYLIRCLYLNGQRRCPCCNPCKRQCCPDKSVLKARREKERELRRAKQKDNNEMEKGKGMGSGSELDTSTSNHFMNKQNQDETSVIIKREKKISTIIPTSSLVAKKKENNTNTNTNTNADSDDEDDDDDIMLDDQDSITKEIIEFPSVISKKWLCLFLVMTWLPMLGGVIYVGMFIVPNVVTEIRMITIPTSFEWKTTNIDEIMDYRNIHKEVIPLKAIDIESKEEIERGYGQPWERLWKFPSRYVTATIDLPIPRIVTVIFALVLDVVVVVQLSKQSRIDELLRPLLNIIPFNICRARQKFRLNLYHHSGELMDIPNTLLSDHIIYDDLPLTGTHVNFNNRQNQRVGAVQLKRIKSVLGVTSAFAKWTAFGLVFSGLPWVSYA